MVELVDTYALGAYASRRAGSSPVPGTRDLVFLDPLSEGFIFLRHCAKMPACQRENIPL